MPEPEKEYTITLPHNQMTVLLTLNMVGMNAVRGDIEDTIESVVAARRVVAYTGVEGMRAYTKAMMKTAIMIQADAAEEARRS